MTKAFRLLPWFLLPAWAAFAQGVGIGTTSPDASAVLEVRSTSQGLLPPRLSQAQRDAIASPAAGLVVYQTDTAPGLYVYSGTGWVSLGADNLGNHTATQNLNLQANALVGSGADLGKVLGVGVRADGGLNLGQNTTGNNVYLGYQAGQTNSTGINNLFSGYRSGAGNTTGSYNLFSGNLSGTGTTTGSANLFSGYQSGYNNTTGSANVFTGHLSGNFNTTGNYNTAVGYAAGPTVGTLTNAAAFGSEAQVSQSNSLVLGGKGPNAVSVGIGTSAPSQELEVGGQAAPALLLHSNGNNLVTGATLQFRESSTAYGWNLRHNNGGSEGGGTDDRLVLERLNGAAASAVMAWDQISGNVGIGTTTPGQLLDVNGTTRTTNAVVTTALTGSGDDLGSVVGVGVRADGGLNLGQNNVGFNIYLGFLAGQVTTTGNSNSFLGYGAGQSNTTGSNNQFCGYLSGASTMTGSGNTFSGGYSGVISTTGSNNTFTGFDSGANSMTGSNNTALGYNAGPLGGSGTLNNSLALGANASVTASNTIQLGDGNITSLRCQVGLTQTSDARFKYDVRADVPGLAFVTALRPVTYRLDAARLGQFTRTGHLPARSAPDSTAARRTGFLAQQVAQAAQALHYAFDGVHTPASARDYYGLDYAQFVVPLVRAVQEQQKQLDALQAQNAALQARLAQAEADHADLQALKQQLTHLPASEIISASR